MLMNGERLQEKEQWKECRYQTLAACLKSMSKNNTYDGLHIEELSWQLRYGRATEAILLKPENAKGKLPAVLAFHDHGGNKYFGTRKITKISDQQHPTMIQHHPFYRRPSVEAPGI